MSKPQGNRDIKQRFYSTAAWQKCRDDYKKSVGGLCERCYANGIIRHGSIVHHKIRLTADNINDPAVTMNYENMECLCRSCHAEIHRDNIRRYEVDENGHVRGRD